MKTIIFSVLVASVILISCGRGNKTICDSLELEKPTLTDSLDYVIINTIIDSIYADFKFIHINQETDSSVSLDNLQEKLSSHNIKIDTLTLQDYYKKNDVYYTLANRFNHSNVHLLGNDEFECLFSGENPFTGWENYYQKYPKSSGIYTFTRPGIHNDTAVIKYSWLADASVGEGYIVILQKQNNDKWKIIHNFVIWGL